MSVPSVATSLSPHPTSASSIFSSFSYLTETTMVTPTEGLVSQQILSLPSSSTIVDMATLNSLNMHSCNGTNSDCGNAALPPSQESSSFPVDSETCISNLTISRATEFGGNSIVDQENFEPSSRLYVNHNFSNSNCIYNVDKPHTPTLSSSKVKNTEIKVMSINGNAFVDHEPLLLKDTLPEPHSPMSDKVNDCNACCKIELGCEVASCSQTKIKRIDEKVAEDLANSCSSSEKESQLFFSLKPLPVLHSSTEKNEPGDASIVQSHEENRKEFNSDKASDNSCSRCNTDNLLISSSNGALQLFSHAGGKFNCSFLCQNSYIKSSSAVDFSRCHFIDSSVSGRNASVCMTSLSDLPFQINSFPLKFSKESFSCRNYSGANVLSIPRNLVDKELYVWKSALIRSPQNCVNSDGLPELFSIKMSRTSDFISPNLEFNIFNHNYLCCDSRKRQFEEPLALVLAEIPSFSEHVVSLDLSEILSQLANENLDLGNKAVFGKKLVHLNKTCSSKDGSLSFIKIISLENRLHSKCENVISNYFPCDQVFIEVNRGDGILLKLKLSSSSVIFPLSGTESVGEGSLNGCMPCAVIQLKKQLPINEENSLGSSDDGVSKPLYVGLLVPSTKLLHSLNISICQKDSMSIRLGSSRPNQQYSTHTSVDLQFNGNNVECIPIIPLGVYSKREYSDPDFKFLTPVAENSYRDVHTVDDIFLIHKGSKQEILNPGANSRKQCGSSRTVEAKSSIWSHAAESGRSKREKEGLDTFSNRIHSELHPEGGMNTSFQSSILSDRMEKRLEKAGRNPEGLFPTNIISHENEAMPEEKQPNGIKCKDILDDLHNSDNLAGIRNGLISVEGGVSTKSKNQSNPRSCSLPFKTPEAMPHPGRLNPDTRFYINKHKDNTTNDSIIMLGRSPRGMVGALSNVSNSSEKGDHNLSLIDKDLCCGDLKRNGNDQMEREISDLNYYSLKRKTQGKRLEGYFKPLKISKTNKNKLSIDSRKTKKIPDEENVKFREDLNSKLCLTMKSAADSWKRNHYGTNCLSTIKNILVSGNQHQSHKNASKNVSQNIEANDDGTTHSMNYKNDSNTLTIPKMTGYDNFSPRGRSRQPPNFKSLDRKFGRNFLLSTTGSTKRSKLTILIFCLAVTSLLISLHALSNDSSLYIKPTLFLVQEDETTSLFDSENTYARKSSLNHPKNIIRGDATVTGEPIYHGISAKEGEMGAMKGVGTGSSVASIKSRKDMSTWTLESTELKSKSDALNVGDKKSTTIETTDSESPTWIGHNQDAVADLASGSTMENEVRSNPGVSKGTLNLLNSVGFNISKDRLSSATAGNHEEKFNPTLSNEDNYRNNDMTKLKDQNMVDTGSESSKNSDVDSSVVNNGGGVYHTPSLNSVRAAGHSSSENLTRSSANSENHNEFDLNLAFIEKNELNAAYGIDSGTTGIEGNFEEDYGGEDDMVQLATSGNRVKFPKATRRLPQALIIGVRKGGTRALLEMLHLHPLVQKAAGEAHFFDRDENYAKGLQWYRRRMPPSLKGQITVEKSPSYFVTPEVPERVRAMNASIRLLLIVREPVTRAISDFAQLRSHSLAVKANTTIRTKLEGGADEDYGKKLSRPLSSFESLAILPDGRVDTSWRPISVSLYHRHISAWLEAFPRDQILIVDGDQLASNPAPVLASVEKFLKLRPALTPTHFYFNATKGFYCLRSLPPGQQVDGMAMMPSSVSNSPSLPEGKCLRESKGRRHPHVDPSVVHKLRRFFAEHNRRFYEMVGEDFGWPEE